MTAALYGFYEARGQQLQALLNGEPADRSAADAYFDALKAHDKRATEYRAAIDENRGLRCRVDELTAEVEALREENEGLQWDHKDDRPREVGRG